jgi:hypothetical protein
MLVRMAKYKEKVRIVNGSPIIDGFTESLRKNDA